MKVVIFAGGLGTRLMEETESRPKPMVEIGGKPILWHIIKSYLHYGFDDFIICLGYKGFMIKEYFNNYFLHNSDVTMDIKNNSITTLESHAEHFKVTLVDTGLHTKTAGRLKKVEKYLDGETFMLTYGDGVANIDLAKLLSWHKNHNKIATLTTVQPSGRFGWLDIDSNDAIVGFKEKPKGDGGFWINGGFFVLDPQVFDYIPDHADDIMWEEDPMQNLVEANAINAYKHHGFWKCMDALRDKMELDKMWVNGEAKWKSWD